MKIIINVRDREEANKKIAQFFDEYEKDFRYKEGDVVYRKVVRRTTGIPRMLKHKVICCRKDKSGYNSYLVRCDEYIRDVVYRENKIFATVVEAEDAFLNR